MRVTRRDLLATPMVLGAGCLGSPHAESDIGWPPESEFQASARIGFVGDLMLGRNVDDRWQTGSPDGIWTSLTDRLRSLDGLFANLECCISSRGERRPNRTYYFRADPSWVPDALRAAGVSWTSLANNHLLDFGPTALADTRMHLSDAGIAHAGAGPDFGAAIEPSIVDVGDLRVGVLALTDNSPSYAAGSDSPGTAYAPLGVGDPLTRRVVSRAFDQLRDADPDLVVASLHWGPNWTVAPDTRQRTLARWLVDGGVDVVHGHSSHVFHGVEVYDGRPIIYDAGDFVDDYVVKPDLRNDLCFLFELGIDGGRLDALELVPVRIEDEAVHPANGEAAAWLRQTMRSRSRRFDTTFRSVGDRLEVPLDEA